MTCYRPQPAVQFKSGFKWQQPRLIYPKHRDADGTRYYPFVPGDDLQAWYYQTELAHHKRHINLPCGVCMGCRSDNARSWSLRMMHEARYSSSAYFVTLTYSPEQIPDNGDLAYWHLTKFWKDARHIFQKTCTPLRYFAAGEYGDKTQRPHYHFAGFDWDIPDLRFFKKTDSGNYYLSESLAECWGRGHVIVAPLEYKSAAYIARYVMKKMHGQTIREYIDHETGEIIEYTVERAFQSKGLGLRWYEDNHDEVWRLDGCLYNNKYLVKPPRYYFKQLEKSDPDFALSIKEKRSSKYPHHFIDFEEDKRLLYQMEARRLQLSALKRELI